LRKAVARGNIRFNWAAKRIEPTPGKSLRPSFADSPANLILALCSFLRPRLFSGSASRSPVS